MAFSAVQIVNEALQQIAAQTQISSLTDGSPAANFANVVYQPTVQLMLREIEPDFARLIAPLIVSGAAPFPWAHSYAYPADCVRLRQVMPTSLIDPNDPFPVRANVSVIGTPPTLTKVILTNLSPAQAVYTSSSVTEAQFDAAFVDAVVRRLANPLAMAISGRPDFAREILETASAMVMTAESIDEGGFRRRS